MGSAALEFQQLLGERLARRLGAPYKFLKSRLELRRSTATGRDVILLSGSNKYSPDVEVAFHFGCHFSAVSAIERRLGIHEHVTHIGQYSPNAGLMRDLHYAGPITWSVNIDSPPASLEAEIVAAIEGIAQPFFSRFNTLLVARDALAHDNTWCFGGPAFWHLLLRADLALNDLAHFENWSTQLAPLQKQQASKLLAEYLHLKSDVA